MSLKSFCLLKRDGQGDGSEVVVALLAFVFTGAEDMGVADAGGVPGQDNADLQVGDQEILVNTAAVAKGVAVKKNVMANQPAVKPGKEVPFKVVRRFEKA